MGLDGCGKFIKFALFIANVLVLIGGIVVLAIGIWTCTDKAGFEKLVGSDLYLSAAIILIVTGCIVIIVSFMGCLGAVREIKCLLIIYFIILLLVFIIMMVGGILGYVFRDSVREKMRPIMLKSMTEDYGINTEITEAWDYLQKELKCCGISDGVVGTANSQSTPRNVWKWQDGPKFSGTQPEKVPLSCCKTTSDGEYVDRQRCLNVDEPVNNYIYTKDCFDSAATVLEDHSVVLGGVGIGISCVLLLGLVFSMILFCLIE